MRAKKIPLEKLTVGTLMRLKQDGLKGIIDGDERVLRIMPPTSARGANARWRKRQPETVKP